MNNLPAACKRGMTRASRHALARALLIICFPLGANAADSKPAAGSELGRKVFTQIAQPSCNICHTLRDAGATGTIGPVLDELRPDAQRVAMAVRKGVGVMPPYDGKLTREQIEAVASYVSRATGAAK